MSSDPPAVISGKQRAPYRLRSELGRGAMGVVYRAEQLDDHGGVVREVAIKMIRPDVTGPSVAKQFRREIASAILLRGKHTVAVHEYGETEAGDLFYVMELVRGSTLREVLNRTPRLPLDRVVEVGRQICEALDEAHHLPHPVVHRDLKPGNVLVERWDERVWIKVSDFGIAKVMGDDSSTRTQTSQSQGTPRYMAPEQCSGDAVDPRTDLYALGVILYEALAGQPPFLGDQMSVLYQHRYQPPPRLPPSVPEPIRHLIHRLLAKDPKDRPGDAQQARRELEAAWNAARDPALPDRAPRSPTSADITRRLWADAAGQPTPSVRRSTWRYGLAAAVGAVAVIATALAIGGKDLARQKVAAPLAPVAAGEPLARAAVIAQGQQLARVVDAAAEQPRPGAARRTTVAVLAFRNERPEDRDHEWIATALQASFSTELNKIGELRVVSRERVDEVAPTARSGLDAVRSLGAQKMVAGSFAVLQERIRVDVWLIDVDSGLQEMAETVEGGLDEFFGLQKRIALAMLEHLPVAVPQRERQAIAARNPSENPGAALDAYRWMLQSEGLDEGEPPAGEGGGGGPQSRLAPVGQPPTVIGRLIDAITPWPGRALADDVPAEEGSIRRVLEDYRVALEKGDLEAISRTRGELSERRRKGLEEYYKIAEDLQVEFDSVEISQIDESHFAVSFVRRDKFADRRTGEKASLEVRLENIAVRDGGSWRLQDKKVTNANQES